MVSCALFDFDGTIADSTEVIFSIVSDMAPAFGYPQLSLEDKAWIREHAYADMIKKFRISPIHLPFFISRSRSEFKKRFDQVRIHPGIKECLTALSEKGVLCAVVTSNVRENVELFIERNSIGAHIAFVETDPTLLFKHRVIKRVIQKRALNPETVCYIGDEIRDIRASAKAGIQFVGVDWGLNTASSLYKSGAKHVCKTTEELGTYLLQSA